MAFAGRGFGRMAPAMLRLRLAAPQALSLFHSSRNRVIAVSWTSGSSSMPCKLQYYDGTWKDVTATVSSPLNCGANAVSINVNLNADGWINSAGWNGTQMRILRIADSAVLGTFPQTLSCTTTSGSSSSTPNIDEDCNGTWDNVQYSGGCGGGTTCYYYGHCSSSGSPCYNYTGCRITGQNYYGAACPGGGPQDCSDGDKNCYCSYADPSACMTSTYY